MTTTTTPSLTNGAALAAGSVSTSPTSADAGARAAEVAAVTSGVATMYWAELLPIPAAAPRLWFYADSAWRALNGASPLQFDMVQEAFLGTGSTVTVWFDGATVVGLVVSGN